MDPAPDAPAPPSSPPDSAPDETLFAACEETLRYRFKDRTLLATALTHASLTTGEKSYERMEFLGDAVLGMVIAHELYRAHPSYGEGALTKIKSVVVSRPSLAAVSREHNLGRFLQVGKGLAGGNDLPSSLLSDLYEALVAALYLDGGLPEAERFIRETLAGAAVRAHADRDRSNYKSLLQQHAQEALLVTPRYEVVRTWGPDHAREFEVTVILGATRGEKGRGRTKKDAEQAAAEATMKRIRGEDVEELLS
ncbi:MAG: ribonuclease III [Planctomycetota bacterium]